MTSTPTLPWSIVAFNTNPHQTSWAAKEPQITNLPSRFSHSHPIAIPALRIVPNHAQSLCFDGYGSLYIPYLFSTVPVSTEPIHPFDSYKYIHFKFRIIKTSDIQMLIALVTVLTAFEHKGISQFKIHKKIN